MLCSCSHACWQVPQATGCANLSRVWLRMRARPPIVFLPRQKHPQDGPKPKSRSLMRLMRDVAEKHICTYRAAQNGRDGSRMNELVVGKAHPARTEMLLQ